MTWWRGGVLYQVYPRSFADSDGDGIGDLDGITEHLDHLRGRPHSLGVDGVWISPFYPSPGADTGYDVSDYTGVDAQYGDLAGFDRLVAAARARDLRVVLDLIPGHTSVEHPWFHAARSSRSDPHRGFYIWRDPAPDGGPPNGWTSVFGGSAWEWDEATGQYYLHSFYPEQPDLDWRSPAVHERFAEIVRFWLERGVDGFRVDAIDRSMKDLLLRENPPTVTATRKYDAFRGQHHLWNKDRPEVIDVVRSLRRATDRVRPGTLLLGESYVAAERLGRYLGDAIGDGFDLAFDFPFLHAPWDAGALRHAVDLGEAHLPPHGWPCRAFSNHDNSRHGSRYGSASLRAAAVLLLSLRGTPVLYMGEEIGMLDVPLGEVHDRAGRDAARTPMQWRDAPGAGFTDGRPWLPLGGTAAANVESQRDDPRSLLSLYRAVIALRHGSVALREGEHRSIATDPESGLLAFLRDAPGERLLVAIDVGGRGGEHDLARAARGGLPPEAAVALSSEVDRPPGETVDLRRLAVAPGEGLVLAV